MRVVLLDDIANLGEAGAVVEVKNGYARNWLLPKRLAERATADSLNRIGLIQRAAEVKRARRKSEAAEKFAGLTGKSITLRVKAGTQSRIFGSITSSAIVDEVRKQLGVTLDRRHIMLEEPIKHLGEFNVPLRAAADVTGEIKVIVEPEGPRGGGRPGARTVRTAAPAAAPAAEPLAEEIAPNSDAGGSEPAPDSPAEAATSDGEPAAMDATEAAYEDIEASIEG